MTFFKKNFWLFAIFFLALFLRVYHIQSTPPGIYPDEAVNGIDALKAYKTNHYQLFYPDNNGREGLYINIIALFFKLFGVSVFTLKSASILFGTLTVLSVYLLTKELFQNPKMGLISSFLVAVSFWAINFSRISFRASMIPFLLAISFYFLFKGLRTKKWINFAAGGFLFGLGLHTYIAFRVAPLILIAMFFVLTISRESFLRKYWKFILVFLFFAIISAGPMFYTFFVSHPEYWESRTANISILNPEVNQGHLLKTFAKTFSLSLLKYNFWGDQNWRHNFPPYAILDPLTGIAFLFGFIYSCLSFFRLLFLRLKRKERPRYLEIYAFLLSFFFIMLIPEFMALEGSPHALRAIGTLPVVFIFSALTFNFFFQKFINNNSILRKITASFIIVCLVFIGIFNSLKYHFVWAKKVETAHSFDKEIMDISQYLKTLPEQKEKFVIAKSMERIPIQLFNNNQPNVFYFYPEQIKDIDPVDEKNFIIILSEKNDSTMAEIQKKFPQLRIEEKKDNFGISFYVFR